MDDQQAIKKLADLHATILPEGPGKLNREALRYAIICIINKMDPFSVDIVIGCSFSGQPIHGITEGKKYKVIDTGKDEVIVKNDFGDEEAYSSNCFEERIVY